MEITSQSQQITVDLSQTIPSIPPCRDTNEINDYKYGKWFNLTVNDSHTIELNDITITNKVTNKKEVSKELFIQISEFVNGNVVKQFISSSTNSEI